MTVLLYGVTSAGAAVAGAGLDGRPLRTLEVGPLQAVLSDQSAPPAADTETLWSYEAVLERLMATTTIVPARFGTVAEDEGPIRELLDERRPELQLTLERVGGAVELAVHLEPAPAGPAHSGTEYLTSRLQQRRQVEALDAAAAGLFRERANTGGRSTGYLVDATHVDRFIQAAGQAGAAVTGPWPPFSFVR